MYQYTTAAGAFLGFYVLGVLLYGIGIAVYRVTFHPLAKIPGPKIAAFTQCYQTIHGPKYYKIIGKWHEKYGECLLSFLFQFVFRSTRLTSVNRTCGENNTRRNFSLVSPEYI